MLRILPVNLIPQPVDIQQSEGQFLLTQTSTVGYDNQDVRKIAEMFSQKLNSATGFSIKPQQASTASMTI